MTVQFLLPLDGFYFVASRGSRYAFGLTIIYMRVCGSLGHSIVVSCECESKPACSGSIRNSLTPLPCIGVGCPLLKMHEYLELALP